MYIDSHIYHAFGGEEQQPTPWRNIDYTCQKDAPLIAQHTNTDWTIVGEWSLATGVCMCACVHVCVGIGGLLCCRMFASSLSWW